MSLPTSMLFQGWDLGVRNCMLILAPILSYTYQASFHQWTLTDTSSFFSFGPEFNQRRWGTCWAPWETHTTCITTGNLRYSTMGRVLSMSLSVQLSWVAQSCPTLCDPINLSTPGLPVHHQLPEFTQTHVHRVGDGIQPSHPLSSPFPPAPNPSQHQCLFQWVNSSQCPYKQQEIVSKG